MTTKNKHHLWWFETVCYESETNGFCRNRFRIVNRLDVVNDNQSLGSSVIIWWSLLLIGNQRFLQQPFHVCETSQCCPLQHETYDDRYWFAEMCFKSGTNCFCDSRFVIVNRFNVVHDSQSIGASVQIRKRCASNLKATDSARPIFRWWSVSMLSTTTKPIIIVTDSKRFASNLKPTVLCNDRFLVVKHLNVVHDSQNLGSSVLIWRGPLRIWNQRFLQQLFSYGETCQCCPWQPTL